MKRVKSLITALTTKNTKTNRNAAINALKEHFDEYGDDFSKFIECINETELIPGTLEGQGGGSRRKSAKRSSRRKSAKRSSRRKSAKRSSRRKSLKYKSHKPTKLSFTANDYLIYN